MNYSHEELQEDLQTLEEAGVISNSEKNLRSKIDSILRSLDNLTSKKIRIEFEIKRQKKSLLRKRMELKKSTKSTTKRITAAVESHQIEIKEKISPRFWDNYLLQRSDQILDD